MIFVASPAAAREQVSSDRIAGAASYYGSSNPLYLQGVQGMMGRGERRMRGWAGRITTRQDNIICCWGVAYLLLLLIMLTWCCVCAAGAVTQWPLQALKNSECSSDTSCLLVEHTTTWCVLRCVVVGWRCGCRWLSWPGG